MIWARGVTCLGHLTTLNKALTEGANQISWKRALDTIDVRIGVYSHIEYRSLRYSRGVIGKVHADFRANLQGADRPRSCR